MCEGRLVGGSIYVNSPARDDLMVKNSAAEEPMRVKAILRCCVGAAARHTAPHSKVRLHGESAAAASVGGDTNTHDTTHLRRKRLEHSGRIILYNYSRTGSIIRVIHRRTDAGASWPRIGAALLMRWGTTGQPERSDWMRCARARVLCRPLAQLTRYDIARARAELNASSQFRGNFERSTLHSDFMLHYMDHSYETSIFHVPQILSIQKNCHAATATSN